LGKSRIGFAHFFNPITTTICHLANLQPKKIKHGADLYNAIRWINAITIINSKILHMKYFLLIVSIIILIYAGYGFIKCIEAVGSLTEYGKGFLTGSIILLVLGFSMLAYSIKMIRR
jgi:hypothetical protein